MNSKIRFCSIVLLIPLVILLSSCREVPDVQPFADAIAELQSTVSKAFDGMQKLIDESVNDNESNDEEQAELNKKTQNQIELAEANNKLVAAWETTDVALGAAVNYSDQIAAVAAAGKGGREAVGKVADSVNTLASMIPGLGSVPAVMLDFVNILSDKAADARAAKDINTATGNAAMAVNEASKIIANNLEILIELTKNAGLNYATSIYVGNQGLLEYYNQLIEGQRQDARLLSAVVELNQIPKRVCNVLLKGKSLVEQVDACNPKAPDFNRKASEMKRDQLVKLREIDASFLNVDVNSMGDLAKRRQGEVLKNASLVQGELARIKPEVDKIQTKIADIFKRTEASVAIFDKASKAIAAWAKSHQSLVSAVQEERPKFAVREFIVLVKEAADAAKQGEK